MKPRKLPTPPLSLHSLTIMEHNSIGGEREGGRERERERFEYERMRERK
jgi:hypothetical protein